VLLERNYCLSDAGVVSKPFLRCEAECDKPTGGG
jgi:hypothetical protein